MITQSFLEYCSKTRFRRWFSIGTSTIDCGVSIRIKHKDTQQSASKKITKNCKDYEEH